MLVPFVYLPVIAALVLLGCLAVALGGFIWPARYMMAASLFCFALALGSSGHRGGSVLLASLLLAVASLRSCRGKTLLFSRSAMEGDV